MHVGATCKISPTAQPRQWSTPSKTPRAPELMGGSRTKEGRAETYNLFMYKDKQYASRRA